MKHKGMAIPTSAGMTASSDQSQGPMAILFLTLRMKNRPTRTPLTAPSASGSAGLSWV